MEVFVELRRSYIRGTKSFAHHVLEYSSYSTNLASDWLRAESSPVDEREEREKMDDGIAR